MSTALETDKPRKVYRVQHPFKNGTGVRLTNPTIARYVESVSQVTQSLRRKIAESSIGQRIAQVNRRQG